MVKLPKPPEDSKTVEQIYKSYERQAEKHPRKYLGASAIGKPCERALWYDFRHCGVPGRFNGRVLRLFQTGHLEEPRLVMDLRNIGCEVHEKDPETGEQFGFKAFGGHFGGHMDGCARGIPEAPKTWHVVEFKTASEKRFDEMKRKGLKEAAPEYYAQVMVYMKLSGMRRAIIIIKNKNTDHLYSERIPYDKDEAEAIMERARRIIFSKRPPPKISDNPDHPVCTYCGLNQLCHGANPPDPAVPSIVSCRNCVHSTPTEWGAWNCERHRKKLSIQEQQAACDDHLFIPDLVTFARQEDAGDNWIAYRNADNFKWRNGKGPKEYPSKVLNQMPSPMVY